MGINGLGRIRQAVALAVAVAGLLAAPALAAPTGLANPILFVGQVPVPADFTTIGSVFGNQLPDPESCARGGDLYILYSDGTLRNLTREAGFGNDGFQGAGSIAVRDPSVDWSGTKALFSMVVGAPVEQYVPVETHWQIYEVTGLGQGQHATIARVANQPAGYDNVSPLYSPDGRILFTSDRPRDGQAQLYPQLDEYEEAPTVSGLWSLDPATGELQILDHAPSGAFTPIVDSAGRVVYTRWDHLQRDQQADTDAIEHTDTYGTFNWSSEAANSTPLQTNAEVFPEPRSARTDLLAGTNLQGHEFNHFFPWGINPDGTEHETLNHVGRHELHGYFDRALNDDDNLVEFIADESGRTNPNPVENLLQIKEDPTRPGTFFAVDAPEFRTHAAGGVVSWNSPDGLPADQIRVTYVTNPVTRDVTEEGAPPPTGTTGHYRDPLPLAGGGLLAVQADETRADVNQGTRESPLSRYAFRLKKLVFDGTYWKTGAALTAGITKTISYYDPDALVSYSGPLWELQPAEVRARPKPPLRHASLQPPEAQAFASAGVDPAAFAEFLRARDLAVGVSRNVTTRDIADRQQPFNLKVAGSATQTIGAPGKVYTVSHLQFFEGDLLRSLGGPASPEPGRRVLAQPLHDLAVPNPPTQGPAGSVAVAADGSVAAFLPAHRALTWQLVDATAPAATPVVRERYWLTLQPGEVRVCTSCHGINSHGQAGEAPPTNSPAALRSLLTYWKTQLLQPCQASDTTLCLRGNRFAVQVSFDDPRVGRGSGHAVGLTGDTGTFWFFAAANRELVVKVLDGRGLNGAFWVFYGSLSDVGFRLTVTDTLSGRSKTYVNVSGTMASVGDTTALPSASGWTPAAAAPVAFAAAPASAAATCTPGATAVCLQGGRFRLAATWRDFQGHTGSGQAVQLTPDTGYLWFFDPANVEVVAKVLDGRPTNGKFWVFYGALSNVEYTLTVTDTATGRVRQYHNPAGTFASRGDTAAF